MADLPPLAFPTRLGASACAAATSLALFGAVTGAFGQASPATDTEIAGDAPPHLFARIDLAAVSASPYVRAILGDQPIAGAGPCRPLVACLR